MTVPPHLSVAGRDARAQGQCLPVLEQEMNGAEDCSQTSHRKRGQTVRAWKRARGEMQGGCISSLARCVVHMGGGTSPNVKGLRGEEAAGRVGSRALTLKQSSPRVGAQSMVRGILEQVFT